MKIRYIKGLKILPVLEKFLGEPLLCFQLRLPQKVFTHYFHSTNQLIRNEISLMAVAMNQKNLRSDF
jgi:hypothetical protein